MAVASPPGPGHACAPQSKPTALPAQQAEFSGQTAEREEPLDVLFHASPDAVFLSDADGRVCAANPAASRMFGYTEAELMAVGRAGIADLADPRLAQAVALRDRTGASDAQFTMMRKDGSRFTGWVTSRAFLNPAGQQRHCTIVRDMTEHEAIVAALRASDERFRRVLEHAPVIVGDFDRDARHIWLHGPHAVHDPAAVLGLRPDELAQFIDGAKVTEAILATVKTGAPRRLEGRMMQQDGQERTYDISLEPRFEASGEISGASFVTLDISKRVRAEKALHETERRFREAFEDSGIGMALFALDGTYLRANRALCALLGYSEAELQQCKLQDLTHDDDREADLASMQHLLAGEVRTAHLRTRKRRKDGREVTLDATRTLVRDDAGRPQYFIGQMQDVTRQAQLEHKLRQAKRLEAVGRLAGGIAHDFNNMLTAIRGRAELLALSETDATRREDAEAILLAANRAAGLTASLLAFSRRQLLRPTWTDVNQLVRETLPLVRHAGPSTGLELDLGPEPGHVMVDPAPLQQAVVNLVLNARDAVRARFSDRNEGRIRIATARIVQDAHSEASTGTKPGRYVCLTVEDNGTGMDEATRAHLFEPFFTTKTQGGGTGLGLAMVYGFIRQSGGYVEVDSTLGRGTSIQLFLPEVSQPAQQSLPLADPAPVPSRATKARVLLVDDEPTVLGLAERVLLQAGFEVVAIGTGDGALQRLESGEHFDAVLTDLVMPGVDGRQVLELVRRTQPQMPAAAMSGFASDEDTQRLLKRQDIALLAKPFGAAELVKFVSDLVSLVR